MMANLGKLGRFFAFSALSGLGCETFDPPPHAAIDGAVNGVMTTPRDAALVVRFDEPIAPATLYLRIVKDIRDGENDLLDERQPPDVSGFEASILYRFDAGVGSPGARFALGHGGTTVSVLPEAPFPLAPLIAIVEPGLEDLEGNATKQRLRLPFSYLLTSGGPTSLPSGHYFFLINVDYLEQQLRLDSHIDVDQTTGEWRGQFTNAIRTPLLNDRPGCAALGCGADQICALHRAPPSCVVRSERMLGLDEVLDFAPETDPANNGYSFPIDGYARDEADGTIAFGTTTFDIELLLSGIPIFVDNSLIGGQLTLSPDGKVTGTGSVGVEKVIVNGIDQGPTSGRLEARSLTPAEVAEIEGHGKAIPRR
jgi:hypothetical protein